MQQNSIGGHHERPCYPHDEALDKYKSLRTLIIVNCVNLPGPGLQFFPSPEDYTMLQGYANYWKPNGFARLSSLHKNRTSPQKDRA